MARRFADRWFYRPTDEVYDDPQEWGLSYREHRFDSEGERLCAWFFPAIGKPVGTIVHCHGTGGNLTAQFAFMAEFPALAWNVLCFDYRGYGRSTGLTTREGTIADARAAIDFAKTLDGVDPARLVLFGQSIGGAIGIVAAAGRTDLRAVAIEGAFSSYRQAARFTCRHSLLLFWATPFVNRGLVEPGLDPIDHVALVAPTPLLFVSGDDDRICDHAQTLELHAAARTPRQLWVLPARGHTDLLRDETGDGARRLSGFFRGCLG